MGVSKAEQVPVNIVGSSIFGRYPKISLEKTYNMFISDGWLINYAGFKKKIDVFPEGEGRAIFHSIRGGFLIIVVSSTVYKIASNFTPVFIGQIDSTTDSVFIDENLSSQILIVDRTAAYLYNYANNTFTKQTLTFDGNPIIPGYVCYHNSFFLIGSAPNSINPQNWFAYERDTDTTIKRNTQFSIQTKPDLALAVVRLPGHGNNVLVLGSSVAEVWTQVGGTQNYARVQSFNIDNGVVSVSTIASSDEMVCWLSQNENNSPSILVSDGSSSKRLSTDGIDFLLSTLKHPEQSSAFFYRQDGHLFYQLTFYNESDNLTLIHDFNTGLFFHVADNMMNYHPARQVVYFQKDNYFVSLNDASIYRMNNSLVTYDYSTNINSVGEEIPRIRICKSIRKKDSDRFRVGMLTFWIEQGVNNFHLTDNTCSGFVITQDGGVFILTQGGDRILTQDSICSENPNQPRVDMSFSKNGNQSFSNVVSKLLNPAGQYRNQIRWQRMGQANEFTPQFRFWGFQRFVAQDGIAEVY